MEEKKKRLSQFDQIIALSKKPPAKSVTSLFALGTEAEERRQREAALSKVTAADLPPIPAPKLDIQPPLDIRNIQNSQPELDIQKLDIQNRLDIQSIPDIQNIQSPAQKAPHQYPSRRNTEPLYVRLPFDLMDDIRRWCFENRVNLRDFVMDAVKLKLRPLDIRNIQSIQNIPDMQISTIDDDVDVDDLATIDLYEKLTGNTFSVADRVYLRKYREYGADCIRCALLEGRERARGRQLSSFRYFEKIITEIAGWPPAEIARVLAFRMSVFKSRRARRK